MATTFEWRGHDGSDWNFQVSSTNVIAFFGGSYGSPIQVGSYNEGMHIRTSVADDTDACSPPHLTNLQYTSSTEVSVSGGAGIALTSVTQQNCLRITVSSDTSIAIIASRLYAYDGTNVENAPQNITFKAFNFGNSTWSQPHGRSSALSLGDSTTPATSHQFYFGMSISPTSTGASNLFVVRAEFDIQ